MSNLDKLVKLFTERDNPNHMGMTVGTIIMVHPLRIGYGDHIILEPRHLLVSESLLYGVSGIYEDDNGTSVAKKTVTVLKPLQPGDKVMLIPDSRMKKWYVIDKVVSP
ncbi:DUF2577 family protein [Marinicrinis lubricantis]|uniref:DUF2577 family protein n=1 Tax=Marinicrinis lubricantis TaxID=2086470 RepID=A0ABW1IIU9_9BACL